MLSGTKLRGRTNKKSRLFAIILVELREGSLRKTVSLLVKIHLTRIRLNENKYILKEVTNNQLKIFLNLKILQTKTKIKIKIKKKIKMKIKMKIKIKMKTKM